MNVEIREAQAINQFLQSMNKREANVPGGSLTSEVKEGITGLDVGQEGVPKTLTLSSTLHQASNVCHVQESRNFTAGQNIWYLVCIISVSRNTRGSHRLPSKDHTLPSYNTICTQLHIQPSLKIKTSVNI